jgi:hypothetical protein
MSLPTSRSIPPTPGKLSPAAVTVRILIAGLAILLAPIGAQSELVPCPRAPDARRIADALGRLRGSVDPCGESPEMLAVLDRLEHCVRSRYQICTSAESSRNLFDRPTGSDGEARPRTITWNPGLRSELESGCDGDPARPVMRDPVASLLHEIVHAVHDCEGLNPGEHELEAVRIENIYRRAAGLCQRAGYGEYPLPREMVKSCMPGRCACSVPATDAAGHAPAPLVGPHDDTTATDRQAADSARKPGEIETTR